MTTYNHAYTLALEIVSDDETGMSYTVEDVRAALKRRLDGMDDAEITEALGAPHDTFEVTQPNEDHQ